MKQLKMVLQAINDHIEYLKSDGMEYWDAIEYGRRLSEDYDLPNTGLVDTVVMNVYLRDKGE